MVSSTSPDDELQRFEEKQSCFRGSAKIKLKHLQFETENPELLVLDPENVKRLVQVFQLEGCLRFDLERHIPAIIDENDLFRALQNSQSVSGDLFKRQGPPSLYLYSKTTLKCLHGRHRIAAAREFLLPGDKWWIVDLYSDGITFNKGSISRLPER